MSDYRAENWADGEKVNASQLSVAIGHTMKGHVQKLAQVNGMSVSEYVRELVKRQYGRGNGRALITLKLVEDMPKPKKNW